MTEITEDNLIQINVIEDATYKGDHPWLKNHVGEALFDQDELHWLFRPYEGPGSQEWFRIRYKNIIYNKEQENFHGLQNPGENSQSP